MKHLINIMKKNRHGFTIVELLVVIIVIGILAAITIVSYSGISQRAVVASLSSDLNNSSSQLKLFQIENSVFPNTINCAIADSATNKCVRSSDNTSYNYLANLNSKIFCLTASKDNKSYNITQDTVPLAGPCPVLNFNARNTFSYPGSGATLNDLSANGNNGTMLNGAYYSNINGGVMGFDGIDDYVTIANSSTLTTGTMGSLTLSMWIYIRDNLDCDTNNNYRMLLNKSGAFDIILEQSRNFAWDTTTAGFQDRWWPAGTVPLTTWSHVTFIYDQAGYKYAYLNGSLVDTKSITAAPLTGSTNSIAINNISTVCPNGAGSLPGYIGDFRIYNKALSSSEVKAVYDATK